MKSIRILRAGALAALCVLSIPALLVPSPAFAAAPMVRTNAPGFHRLMLGDFEITALSDGTVPLPVDQLLTRIPQPTLQRALQRAFLKSPVETSVNAYLVNTGAKLVLIDVGAGPLFGPTLGHLVANLQAAGYQPEQVDEIYLTHLHADHVGGLVADGSPVFPNAIVRADQGDADFWLSQARMAAAPADRKDFFKGAMVSLNPYVQAGRFKPFSGSTELLPGIHAVARPGHTAGHSAYVVESRGQKLVLWGDLMHVAAVQFERPGVTIAFDSDPNAAAGQRRRAYAEAAREGYLVGAAHLSFPGLGRLREVAGSYVWVPLNYEPLRP